MNLSIRNRLLVGFGVILMLLAVVAGVGQLQLARIQHFNTELDERAFRLSLASDWATKVKLAVATKTAVPALDAEQVKKLMSLTQAEGEKTALDAPLVGAASARVLADGAGEALAPPRGLAFGGAARAGARAWNCWSADTLKTETICTRSCA